MSADTHLQSTPSPSVKFSRYRSVRKALSAPPLARSQLPTPPVPTQLSDEKRTQDATIARSMSRYHKPRHATAQVSHFAALPPMPLKHEKLDSSTSTILTNPGGQIGAVEAPRKQSRGDSVPIRHRDTALVSSTNPQRQRREQERLRRAQEEEEQERLRLAQKKAEEIVAEQKRKDLERLEAQLEAAVPSTVAASKAGSSLEKLGLFARKRSPTKSSPPPQLALSRTISNPDGPPRPELRPAVEPIVAAAGPGVDAPMSAVNAGERRVLIRCKQSSITLPVTPDTTPTNLIYTAANIMTQDINPSTAILLECYNKLGLERPIRRYEHIRDVLNSWDRDTQNSLIIHKTDEPSPELDAASVPRKEPDDVTVHMYHSQRPGRWNKRYITLCSSGQIFVAKKPDAKQSDKDSMQICHLSDFDIYSPTAQELRKSLRPPKQICYAIKSQQKTSVFMSTENFVHFFCTDHADLADQWYDAVQQWRSWYLINKMGEGRNNLKSQVDSRIRPNPTRHIANVSTDENPYTIGTFSPLLDIDRFNDLDGSGLEKEVVPAQGTFPSSRRSCDGAKEPYKKQGYRERQAPPVSYPNMQLPASGYHILEPKNDTTFAPTGLLGSNYEERQKAQKEREIGQSADAFTASSPPFSTRPQSSQYHPSGHMQRALSMRGGHAKRHSIDEPHLPIHNTAGLARSPSKRAPQAPLLDLTPDIIEAPQWTTKNRGHGVSGIPGAPLVEAATTVTAVPPGAGSDGMVQRAGTVRRPVTGNAAERQEGTFIKGSLLERMDADRIRPPGGVIVDRSKAREVDVRVGEGL